MIVSHVKPVGWVDTQEPNVIQPSEVAEMAHDVELEPEDIALLTGPAGPQGIQGPQGVPGVAGVNGLSFVAIDCDLASGTVRVAHGLGRVPLMVFLFIVCKVAGNGYAVGDVVSVTAEYSGSGMLFPVNFLVGTAVDVAVGFDADWAPYLGPGVKASANNWRLRFMVL